MKGMKKVFIGVAASTMLLASSQMAMAVVAPTQAKNVILMISDGQGFNTVKATEYFTGSMAVYESFDVKLAMQTNSANNLAGYNPDLMATNFNYQKSGATDSASAATAMYTGVKNYDGQINWSTTGQALTTYFEMAADAGKSTGAISSVQFSHATPAAVEAHNSSRNNYSAIANEMIYNSDLDVIMGAGWTGSVNNYIGGATVFGDVADGSTTAGHTFINSVADFKALADGTLAASKVLGIASAPSTLSDVYKNSYTNNETVVPTLTTMTKGALNVLGQNTGGFAVMIEGGAVDWEGHANNLGYQITEQVDFNNSVQAVVDYLDANTNGNNWNNTLLIVTADHETGGLFGNSGTDGYFDVNGDGQFTLGVDYAHIGSDGQNAIPGHTWASTNHTNQLVPLYAKGAGAEKFYDYIYGTDANLAAYYGLDASEWDGRYIDNTKVFTVMSEASPVPVPGAAWLLGSVLIGLAGIRRGQEK